VAAGRRRRRKKKEDILVIVATGDWGEGVRERTSRGSLCKCPFITLLDILGARCQPIRAECGSLRVIVHQPCLPLRLRDESGKIMLDCLGPVAVKRSDTVPRGK